MMKTMWRLLLIGALVSATSSTLCAQFHNLGDGNAVTGLSLDGSAATGTNPAEYFIWTEASGVTGIGGQVAGNGIGGQAKISDDGTRVSGTTLNPASGQFEMSRYDTGTGSWTPLGGIGAFCTGGPGDETSSGWGISGDGSSVVGLGWFEFCGPAHAVQYTDASGTTNDLGSTVVDRSSRANATNKDGTVVVGWQDGTSGFRQAAVWENGVQTLISTAAGDELSEAQDVSGDGQWVVGGGSFANDFEPWIWSESTGVQSLGLDCPGCFMPRGFATGVSDDGSVVVGFARGFSGPPIVGFIWTEDTGSVPLNDYVAGLGIDTGGFDFAQPLAISGDGRTIGGAGGLGFFPTDGFVITIPEPSSLALLSMMGLAAVALRRRTR